jgi:hypothetical protein
MKRFVNEDTVLGGIMNSQSLNRFAYVNGNPVSMVDPLGLCGENAGGSKGWGTTALDWTQTGLDVAGLVPGFGELFDGANALIYAGRGDYINTGLSAAAMIPFAGWGATGGKLGRKALKYGDEVLEGAGELAKNGFLDASKIRYTQSSIKSSFKSGDSIYDTISGLKSGKIKPSDIPEIRIFEKDGNLYSLDNRRLFAAQEAGVNVKYRMATPEEVANEAWKFTTKNDGTSIKVR